MSTRIRCAAGLLAGTAFVAPAAFAAGGHHAVDDAAILESGCEQESWFSRETGGARLLHAGLNCRLGPVEVGGSGEYARFQGASATGWGLEVKWATEVAPGLRVGAVLQPAWQARVRPRYQGATFLALATWEAREDLAFHFNAGRDFVHRGDDEARWGVAGEWGFREGWSAVLERYREQATHFARAGVRWAIRDGLSVDLSRAHRISGPAPSAWTFGVTLGFGGS